jgi:hypothetical protein
MFTEAAEKAAKNNAAKSNTSMEEEDIIGGEDQCPMTTANLKIFSLKQMK